MRADSSLFESALVVPPSNCRCTELFECSLLVADFLLVVAVVVVWVLCAWVDPDDVLRSVLVGGQIILHIIGDLLGSIKCPAESHCLHRCKHAHPRI